MAEKLILKKMKTSNFPEVDYELEGLKLNPLVGNSLQIKFTDHIECIYCSRKIKKTFNQGYCFPCSQKLARCDLCIVRPERCHYHQGTCREPEWGEKNCLIEHSIYLANTAGLKVGITRSHQKETRWIDQGAVATLEIAKVSERLEAGNFEIALKEFLSDRTDWRKMVTGKDQDIDLISEFENLLEKVPPDIQSNLFSKDNLVKNTIKYPVKSYPQKASSFNEKKSDTISDKLIGIRGQYLLFENTVINIRKFQGYEVEIAC